MLLGEGGGKERMGCMSAQVFLLSAREPDLPHFLPLLPLRIVAPQTLVKRGKGDGGQLQPRLRAPGITLEPLEREGPKDKCGSALVLTALSRSRGLVNVGAGVLQLCVHLSLVRSAFDCTSQQPVP